MTGEELQAIYDLLFDDHERGTMTNESETETTLLARLNAAARRHQRGERIRVPAVPAAQAVGAIHEHEKDGFCGNGRIPPRRHDEVTAPFGGRPWMQTYAGNCVPLVGTSPDDIRWYDINSHLSFSNRFAGAAGAYSVAQHSCIVADMLPGYWRAYGLLHDAHEAYIGDITQPAVGGMEAHLVGGGVKEAIRALKETLDRAIFTKAGLTYPMPTDIKEGVHTADMRVLMTEKRDLMGPGPYPWGARYEHAAPLPEKIIRWAPLRAQGEFFDRLRRFGIV